MAVDTLAAVVAAADPTAALMAAVPRTQATDPTGGVNEQGPSLSFRQTSWAISTSSSINSRRSVATFATNTN